MTPQGTPQQAFVATNPALDALKARTAPTQQFARPTMREGLNGASEPQVIAEKFATGLIRQEITPQEVIAQLGEGLGMAAIQMADSMMGAQPVQPQGMGLGPL